MDHFRTLFILHQPYLKLPHHKTQSPPRLATIWEAYVSGTQGPAPTVYTSALLFPSSCERKFGSTLVAEEQLTLNTSMPALITGSSTTSWVLLEENICGSMLIRLRKIKGRGEGRYTQKEKERVGRISGTHSLSL